MSTPEPTYEEMYTAWVELRRQREAEALSSSDEMPKPLPPSVSNSIDALVGAAFNRQAQATFVAESATIRFVDRSAELITSTVYNQRQPIINTLMEAGRLLHSILGNPDRRVIITVTFEPHHRMDWKASAATTADGAE